MLRDELKKLRREKIKSWHEDQFDEENGGLSNNFAYETKIEEENPEVKNNFQYKVQLKEIEGEKRSNFEKKSNLKEKNSEVLNAKYESSDELAIKLLKSTDKNYENIFTDIDVFKRFLRRKKSSKSQIIKFKTQALRSTTKQ